MVGALAVGIDVGGTKSLGVALDERGAVIAEQRRPTPSGATAVLDTVDEIARALGVAVDAGIGALGVGVAGLVDRSGRWRAAPNVAGIVEVDVAGDLARRFPGVAITVDNDATSATYAEWQSGAGRGAEDMVLVTLGTGIGGGVVAGGQLQRGANGFAGEIGHMIVDPSGPVCVCGQRGCWERFASGAGLAWLAGQARAAGALDPAILAEDAVGEAVVAAARRGDPDAVAVLATFAWWIALGLSNLTNALDPAVIVIGGGLADAGDLLIGPVDEAFRSLLYARRQRVPPAIVVAALGPRAGAIGAALLASGGTGGV